MVEKSDVRVVRCGGSKINLRPPIISTDSRFVLCASGDSVKVYSTRTEEWLHSLQGHTNQVTGIALNPANHLQVYSCSADGTVKLWDFIDGILIKVQLVLFFLHAVDKSKICFQLVAVHLPKSAEQEVEAKELSAVSSRISPNPSCTAFGREGQYIAFARHLQLNVYFFRKQKTYSFSLKATDKKGAKNAFTCIACHPADDCIATGHEDGKIRLWRNFIHTKEYTYSTQHWHHNAVNTLCFTPEGTNLLSGGIESVLVQWQYGAGNRKEFLPRLGGSILHVSTSSDGQLFCTSHSDNKITVIESSFKVCGVIQGLVKDAVFTDLMIDPRSKALVLNGKPGHLQFYSLLRDKHLYNLDIVQQEYIYEAGLDQFEVVKAAFDIKGYWLATVEERGQKSSDLEFVLKLWAYDERTQSFVLNTTITAAHTDRIISMCFSSSEETTMLVTTAEDGQFKAWCQGADADTQQDQSFWSCDFVGSYHNLTPTNCSFSADSSLLAVSFQEVITIWSPDTWELLTTLCQPPGVVRDLCFGQLSCSKYLIATTTRNLLCCWNLLTCALEWSTSVEVSKLQPDPLSENVAAFSYQSKHTDLFVFKPNEPRPLFTHKNVCSEKIHRAVFVPREELLNNCDESSQWLNRSQLYFLTQNMVFHNFTCVSLVQLVIDDSIAVTPFYLLLGKHRQQQQKLNTPSHPAADKPQQPQGSVTITELLHTPAHVLPAASVLCSMFVSSLLISNTGVREMESSEQEMNSEKEEEHSEEEMEACDSQQELRAQGSVDEVTPKLSKAQERELKRVRKTDFSWMAGLIDSKP
uniref:WD repeat-containing protein 75-like n=1 Tax=Sinocyclocheilus anshuiensis TaxID=1608454 RepID=A0A671L180_9TELE